MYRHSSVYELEGEPMPISGRELRDSELEIPGAKTTLRPLRVNHSWHFISLINSDRDHLSQHGDKTTAKYRKASDVAREILDPDNLFWLGFGIWKDETMVGAIGLEPMEDNRAYIGYWVGKEHVRNGYGYDALSTLARFAFDELGYDELEAEVAWENEPSQGLLRKVGFVETGEVRGKYFINEDGQEDVRPCLVYTLHKLTANQPEPLSDLLSS